MEQSKQGVGAGPLLRPPSPTRVPADRLPGCHGADPRLGCPSRLSPPPQESQEQELRRRLVDEQFAVLRATATEAQRILRDAVAKLDDPLHLRCTSSPGRAFPSLPVGVLSPPREEGRKAMRPRAGSAPDRLSLCPQTTW